jgi:hypothetical protein
MAGIWTAPFLPVVHSPFFGYGFIDHSCILPQKVPSGRPRADQAAAGNQG